MPIDKVDLPLKLFKRGKVRDVYEIDDKLLIVSTDRISAFDYVLPSLIPDKGKYLNEISSHWFRETRQLMPNHIVNDKPALLPELSEFAPQIAGRSVLTRKLRCFPIEAIVRAYIVGSGWAKYQKEGEICKIKLPAGLRFADRLAQPIFTPTTKEDVGHDRDIGFDEMVAMIGAKEAEMIRSMSLELFQSVSRIAAAKGIIVADTKFEFGVIEGNVVLVDEVLTPDSSRFWSLKDYAPGKSQDSYDKQIVRDYLNTLDWPKTYPGPELPPEVAKKTSERYKEIYTILTGEKL